MKVSVLLGSTIADLREHYIQPLLKIRLSSVVVQVGTNDANQEVANADESCMLCSILKKKLRKTSSDVR